MNSGCVKRVAVGVYLAECLDFLALAMTGQPDKLLNVLQGLHEIAFVPGR
jgi:hypothetical protein